MTEFADYPSEIQATSTTNWEVSNADLPLIPELKINPSTYGGYVNQGFYKELQDDGSEEMGSDGFMHCSGLIIVERENQKIIVAHLEPELKEWSFKPAEKAASGLLDDMDQNVPKDLVLIQGDSSSRQNLVENAFASGNFGINSLRKAIVKSGHNRPWGFVFYKSKGEIKVFTREEPGTISTFSIFPELVIPQ